MAQLWYLGESCSVGLAQHGSHEVIGARVQLVLHAVTVLGTMVGSCFAIAKCAEVDSPLRGQLTMDCGKLDTSQLVHDCRR